LETIWRYAVFVFLIILVAGGAYYLGISDIQRQIRSTVTTTSVITVTTTNTFPTGTSQRVITYNDDFVFQVSLDKFAYQNSEPIIVYYNLTYHGKTHVNTTVEFHGFTLRVYNETHNLVCCTIGLAMYNSFPASNGQGIWGKAVIKGNTIDYSWKGESYAWATIQSFFPGKIYRIDGYASFRLSHYYNMTAPSISIFITNKP